MLGTPTREDIHAMNPNYTEFKFPHIKAHPWSKVFSKRLPADAVDLVTHPSHPEPSVAGLHTSSMNYHSRSEAGHKVILAENIPVFREQQSRVMLRRAADMLATGELHARASWRC